MRKNKYTIDVCKQTYPREGERERIALGETISSICFFLPIMPYKYVLGEKKAHQIKRAH
jgi:hypothetical protein